MPVATSSAPTLERLKTWRDEIRVQLHLASMEIKKKWQEIEPEVEQLLQNAETAGTEISQDLVKRFRELRRSMQTRRRPRQEVKRAKTGARRRVVRSPRKARASAL